VEVAEAEDSGLGLSVCTASDTHVWVLGVKGGETTCVTTRTIATINVRNICSFSEKIRKVSVTDMSNLTYNVSVIQRIIC